ncbi:hypothetical protein P7C70_g5418, partial [Phenoliferia sp. Uapishka_3]
MATNRYSSPESPPPLPPPPPRQHSRHLSDFSTSSSSDSSPTASPFKSRSPAHSIRNSADWAYESPAAGANNFEGLSRSRTVGADADERSTSQTLRRRSSGGRPILSTTSQTSANKTTPSAPPSSSTTSFSAANRHRASSLLNRVSPSLANPATSRFLNSTTQVGLRGGVGTTSGLISNSREFSPDFSRGQGQLPSPPATASDGMSNGSGLTGANSGSQSGSIGSSGAPPRKRAGSDAISTPTMRRFQVPTIEKSSPTVAGGSPRSSNGKRYSLQSNSSTGTTLADSSRRTISPTVRRSESFRASPSSSIEPLNLVSSNHRSYSSHNLASPSHLSPDPNSSTSESDAPTLRHLSDDPDSPAMIKGKERERERSGSGSGDELDAKRARRARRATEAKERNQRILDGINSSTLPLDSPPPSHTSNDDGTSPRKRPDTIRRSTTFSTLRSSTPTADEPTRTKSATFVDSPISERRDRPRTSTDEFGSNGGTPTSLRRRSATVGKLGDEVAGESERARRVRTLGRTGGGGANSVDIGRSGSSSRWARDSEEPPDRSYSSMSSYPAHETARLAKSDWLDREYDKRASTSMGDTKERDREIARSLRKLSSRERFEAALAQSDASTRDPDASRRRETSQASSTLRSRPSLPFEFVQTNSSPTTTRNPVPRPIRTGASPSPRAGSPRLNSPRVTSPAFRDRDRATSPLSFTGRGGSVTSPSRADIRSSRQWDAQSERTSNSGQSDVATRRPGSAGLPSDARRGRPNSFTRGKKGSGGSGSTGSGVLPYHHGAEERESRESREAASVARQRSLSRLRTLSLGTALSASESPKTDRDDVFQRGLRTLEDERRRQSSGTTRVTSPTSAGTRFSSEAYDRRERSRGAEIGSDAWLSEYRGLQQSSTRSRASGSSGDARSSREVTPNVPQTPLERDRTIRAINDLLTGSGITPDDLAEVGQQPHTAPGKLGGRYDSDSVRRRKSSATEGRATPPLSSTITRSKSAVGPIYRPESSRTGQMPTAQGSEHHKLLYQAYEYFDAHFTPTEGRDSMAPDSIELVKRMGSMVSSTTKLNAGLRALISASTEAQIEAALDESSRSSASAGFPQFEKSVNLLLRTSDDQIRSLTEGLIAFTRVERERDKLRRDGTEVNTRPASRAAFRAPMQVLSPKRPATSSPFEGATVSMSAVRPLTTARLRDPLDEPDIPTRRTTQSFSSMRSPRSPFAGNESPTPAGGGRRDMTAIRSPLSGCERPSTPSRSANGLPLPNSSDEPQVVSNGIRRSKSSANSSATVRPPTPSSNRLPRSASALPEPILDLTGATAGFSPTRNSNASPRSNGFRAHSVADRPSLDALGIDLGRGERDRERESWRHTLSSSSINFPEVSDSGTEDGSIHSGYQTSAAGRAARPRLSTGSVNISSGVAGAIRSGLSLVRGRRLTNEAMPNHSPDPSLPDAPSYGSSGSTSPDDRKAARRQEVENILR